MSSAAPLASSAAGPAAVRDLPDALRIALNGAVLVAFWNHLWFQDLGDRTLLEAAESGSLITQAVFLSLAVAMLAALHRLGFARLRPIATVPLLLCAGWLGLTVLTSVEPLLSVRRVILLAIAALLAAGMLVVARSPRQLALAFAGAAGVILVSSYLAVALVPGLAVHSAFDVMIEPDHVGLWRGIFPHKNEAGAAMVILVIVGLYVAATASRFWGWTIVAAAATFLVGTNSKTALATLPLVLALSGLARVFTGTAARSLLLVGPILLFSLATVGSVFLPEVREALGLVLKDATFTGRSEIWEFAADHVLQRPILGWGYGAFWRTERTMFAGSESETWVTTANHAHNAYLDAALVMGLPGLALTLIAFVIMPVADLQRIARGRDLDAPTLLFLRLWLLGVVSASFESVLYNGNNATCCMFMLAVFGLRLRCCHRLAGP
ncbi:O-antigen ligase family protein [Methylobacterium sp. A54F]